ncbi:MAG: RNA polymerase sigma-70 factor [Candidatus Pedobacter colombiensis]|uniref:RNA polymerase sigma-70 factor n=1 Tax=Candidatus Pedobacter colombiensis TaxID=3121371 RepID=A0AAJ5WB57_9SPHI|nr:RNA polymerase sigma-70 factor [Pedobacter sp.]WEK20204.1 MAG: RNA polymerase sigma-70 factor [Pedobacter sp.]
MADYTEFTDQEIIEELKADDHAAFNEVHRRHYAMLLRYGYSLISDKEACGDMVQDVFVWFWEHRNQHQIQCIKPYLFTAVRFQAAKFIRKGKVRDAHLLSLNQIDNYSLNEESLEVKELKAVIASFIHQLPDKCAVIFRMSREEHMTNKEIAAKLGISEATVGVQIKRALDKLKNNLGKMHFWMYFFI